eukprot:9699918-Alexandrium_andersonii.AAC.1
MPETASGGTPEGISGAIQALFYAFRRCSAVSTCLIVPNNVSNCLKWPCGWLGAARQTCASADYSPNLDVPCPGYLLKPGIVRTGA